jgi:GNAT superfamily N-acetyltransferase
MSDIRIREMEQDEDFSAWFAEQLQRADEGSNPGAYLEDRYLVLSNEIGDWVGGLRFGLRGGVAHLMEIVVASDQRHQGHAHRLLAAFEARAAESGAHLAEFWTDDAESEGLLGALGWNPVLRRDNYIGLRTWTLLEKRLTAVA